MTDTITLCQLDDIAESSAKGFTIGEKSIFAVRKGGEYFVYQNRCPHLQIEMEYMPDQFLDTDKAFIHCSTHGALFLINNGECVSGPCLGDKLRVIPHTIEGNTLKIAANPELD